MALDTSTGFVASSSNLNEEATLPIFNVERVQLQFSIAADFVAAQVANNVLILALATGRILRIDLDNPADIDGQQPPHHEFLVVKFLTFSDRCRPAEEVVRDWPNQAHVPRPFGVSSYHNNHPWRQLLPSHTV